MKSNVLIRQGLMSTLLSLSFLGLSSTAQSQNENCTPLSVVGASNQTEVSKKVSLPDFVVTGNNWNTDFTIPSGAQYSRFVVSVVSQVGTTYDLAVNLKYNDDTVDQAFQENGATLTVGEPLTIEATARTGQTPYQVNILVGGPNSVDNEYTASVLGCTQ